MLTLLERQVLGGGECEARREQALGAGVRGQIQKQDSARQSTALLHLFAEELGALVRDPDTGEDDGEVLAARAGRGRQAGIAGDVHRDALMRQTAAREQRQLLPADQAVHQVDGGKAGLQEFARRPARGRLHRQTVHPQRPLGGRRRATVQGPTDAVEDAPE